MSVINQPEGEDQAVLKPQPTGDFMEWLQQWRSSLSEAELAELEGVFDGLRDQSEGRRINFQGE